MHLGWTGQGYGHWGMRAGPGLPEDDLHGLDPGLQLSAHAEEAEGRRGVSEAGEHPARHADHFACASQTGSPAPSLGNRRSLGAD